MCGGFFELFLAKDFGASCAEVRNIACQEGIMSNEIDGNCKSISMGRKDIME